MNEEEKTRLGTILSSDFMCILKFLDFIVFVVANFLIYLLFSRLNLFSLYGVYIGILCFIFSLWVLKPSLFLWFLPKLKKWKIENLKGLHSSFRPKIRFLITVSARFVFFNILHSLFPLLLIWLSCIAGVYLFNSSLINFNPDNDVISVLTLLGILFGFFQYYLRRYEDKVQNKLDVFSRIINQTVAEETDFNEFLNSIENTDLKNRINKIINPKERLGEVLKTLTDMDKESKRKISSTLRNIYKSSKPQSFISISISYLPSHEKYKIIEGELNDREQEKLKDEYKRFFAEKKVAVKEKIKSNIDMDEYFYLIINNINIVSESYFAFIRREEPPENKELETSGEFTADLADAIAGELLGKYL